MGAGGTQQQAALVTGVHRATLIRHLRNRPELTRLLDTARQEGKTVRMEAKTMPTATDDPAALLADLQRQRAHLALDVEVGVSGAANKLSAVEERIAEVARQIERQRLAAEERMRREAERVERDRQRQRADAQNQIKKTSGELLNAYSEIEAASETLVAAVKRAVAVGAERDLATAVLAQLDANHNMRQPDATKDRITDRLTYLLNRECGLPDVRCNATFNLGVKPLIEIEKENSR